MDRKNAPGRGDARMIAVFRFVCVHADNGALRQTDVSR